MAVNAYDLAGIDHGLQQATRGGFVPSRLAGASLDDFAAGAHEEFRRFVMEQDFPCVGARAAFNSESYALATYGELGSEEATARLARDLCEFTRSEILETSEYATFVAIFRGPEGCNELEFERRLWQQLTLLNCTDAQHFTWDPDVQSNPADPQFSFSFAGQALYVIGLHGQSSRLARRFPYPTLVFNPHEQFERLRADGKWKRMQQTIRDRDIALQGSVNPMLSDFGEATEARQYAGRAVDPDWQAPFTPAPARGAGKCPFGH